MVNEAPVTLEQAKKLMDEDWKAVIIDDFIRESYFSRNLTYYSLTNPVTGGNGITHKFTRLKNTAKAYTRYVNRSVDDTKVDTLNESVDVKIITTMYRLDRFIGSMGTLEPEVLLQASEAMRAVSRKFEELCILGDSSRDASEFDGILKIASAYGRVVDVSGKPNLDISTVDAIEQNKKRVLFLLDEWLSTFDRKPSFIAGNSRMISCLRGVAREVGQYPTTRDQWGHNVYTYDDIPLVDLGYCADQELVTGNTYSFKQKPIVETDSDGRSCLIAGRFGYDAIYGICPSTASLLQVWAPIFDKTKPEPIQPGSVEMQASLVVNKIQSIGVLKGLKIGTSEFELGNNITTKKGGAK